MSRKIVAAALIALMGLPIAAEAAEERPERGVEVVPRKGNDGGSNRIEPFALRLPEGTTPAGSQNPGGAGSGNASVGSPSLFAVRPPEGITPEGAANQGGGNGPGGNNGSGANVTAPPIITPRPSADLASSGNQRPNFGTGVSGQSVQQIVIPPQGTRPSVPPANVAAIPQPRNNAANNNGHNQPSLDKVSINGVESASDLYRMLVNHGYRVVVRHTGHPGQALFLAKGANHRLTHLLVVDEYGHVLKHQTVNSAAYATGYGTHQPPKPHKPAYTAGHHRAGKACDKPAYARQAAYNHGHKRWARY